jgi:hypothetical protein
VFGRQLPKQSEPGRGVERGPGRTAYEGAGEERVHQLERFKESVDDSGAKAKGLAPHALRACARPESEMDGSCGPPFGATLPEALESSAEP